VIDASPLRTAARSLLATKASSAAAVLVLGLGLGAAAALFSLLDALLVRPLPYPAQERLVAVFETLSARRPARLLVSVPAFGDLKHQPYLEEVAAVARGAGSLDFGDVAAAVQHNRASASLFRLLGVRPELGRVFGDADEQPGAAKVVLLSHELWSRRYGSDPGLVGRQVALDGEPHTVIGVLAPGLLPQLPADVWTPARFTAAQEREDRRRYGLVLALARLAPGITLGVAQARLSLLSQEAREKNPDARALLLVPLREAFTGDLGALSRVLLSAVLLLLLLATANVGNLLLARTAARQRELALRLALGATRRSLIGHLLLEGALLGLCGCGLGLLIALWALELLTPGAGEAIRTAGAVIDGRVAGLTALVGLACGAGAALVPAVQGTRPELAFALKTGLSRKPTAARRRIRSGLVAAEVALSFVLLFGAAQALSGLRTVLSTDPGFDAQGVLALRLHLPAGRYPSAEQQAAFLSALTERASKLDGVLAVGFLANVPLRSSLLWDFDIEGPGGRGQGHVIDQLQIAAPGTAQALRIGLVAGRTFTAEDGPEAPRVALINQALARRYFAGEDPIGKRVRPWPFHYEDAFGEHFWPTASADPPEDGSGWFTVVGVLADVRQARLQLPPRPEVWLSTAQFPVPEGTLLLRQRDELRMAPAVVSAVKAAVADLDPELAISEASPLPALVAASASQERDAVALLAAFASLSLLMAGLGIFGVMVSVVTEREREFGIRLALGAGRSRLVLLLLQQALVIASVGLAFGLLAAPLASAQVALLVVPVPFSPWLCGGAALVLFSCALLASGPPAARAARTGPEVALRHE
jgi:putative ABC transport system permease protein